MNERKWLRYFKCSGCINDENRHILLRWYDSRLQLIRENKRYTFMYTKHIKHLILHKHNRYCIKCIEYALVCKIKHQKHKTIIKYLRDKKMSIYIVIATICLAVSLFFLWKK